MSLEERLKTGSALNPETGCLEWQRHCNADGYGMLWFDGRAGRTHRAAWIAAHGPIPAGLHVLHRCDNRKCVNPEHLFLGTNADNVADKVAKGRQARPTPPRGQDHHLAKLDDDKVRSIRRMLREGASNRIAAQAFGVSVMTVSFIRNGKTWTHVKESA